MTMAPPAAHAATPEEAQYENPFPGPGPFGKEDREHFHGRGLDAHQIISLVQSQQVVLLYAPSGAGKTSLLNAKLQPILRTEAEFDIDILGVAKVDPSPIGGQDNVANVYVAAAVASLVTSHEVDLSRNDLLLRWLRNRRGQKDKFGDPQKKLLILDQFEQILDNPHRQGDWRGEQDAFMAQLDKALEEDPALRLLFVIRQDHLASILRLGDRLTSGFRATYAMDRLTKDQAKRAIVKPGVATGLPFDDDLVERLIKDLSQRFEHGISDRYVEPAQLQVACRKLWQMAHESGADRISLDLYQREIKGLAGALEDHYSEAIKAVTKYHPVQRAFLRRLFSVHLITPDRKRQLVAVGKRRTYFVPNGLLERLEAEHSLVRTELRNGAPYWELSHDGFVEPILRNKRKRVRRYTLLGWLLFAALYLIVVGILLLVPDERPPPRAVVSSVTLDGETLAEGEYDKAFDGDPDTYLELTLAPRSRLVIEFERPYEITNVEMPGQLPGLKRARLQDIPVDIPIQGRARQTYGLISQITLLIEPAEGSKTVQIAELEIWVRPPVDGSPAAEVEP